MLYQKDKVMKQIFQSSVLTERMSQVFELFISGLNLMYSSVKKDENDILSEAYNTHSKRMVIRFFREQISKTEDTITHPETKTGFQKFRHFLNEEEMRFKKEFEEFVMRLDPDQMLDLLSKSFKATERIKSELRRDCNEKKDNVSILSKRINDEVINRVPGINLQVDRKNRRVKPQPNIPLIVFQTLETIKDHPELAQADEIKQIFELWKSPMGLRIKLMFQRKQYHRAYDELSEFFYDVMGEIDHEIVS